MTNIYTNNYFAVSTKKTYKISGYTTTKKTIKITNCKHYLRSLYLSLLAFKLQVY